MRRRLLATALVLASLAGAACLGVVGRGWPASWQAVACAAWMGLATGWILWSVYRDMQARSEAFIRDAIRTVDAIRDGAVVRLPLVGPPDIQALMRKVSMATMAAAENMRQSQANLMSLEVAFDRIHSVLQSLREGVIVIDGMREVVIANPAARLRLRSDQRIVEGRPILDLLAGELRERVDQALQTLPSASDGRLLLTGIEHAGRTLDVSIVRVRSNRSDQDFGTVLALVDVTATHEMARLKDRFLSSVSHELRTPLTNICSFAELLDEQLREGEDEACGEFAGIIQMEGRRLSALVDDLLDYNALETGTAAWDDVDVDLLDVLQDAHRRALPQATAGLLSLELGELPAELRVRGDRRQFAKVLSKLLDNAVKFTPGGGTIRLEARTVAGFVQVSVSDSGIGVQPADRETIFEKFTQVGDTLTDKPSGAGLGLAIARRIVDRAGGKIWCSESTIGGASVQFVLPVVERVGVGE